MRVFLDANILFSAASPESASRRLFDQLTARSVVVTNAHAWEEARRNLEQKRPHLIPHLDEMQNRMEFSARFVRLDDIDLPEKDRPVLGGAVGSGCTHLWTGDKQHFGSLYGMVIRGTRIVSGVMLAMELEKNTHPD